MKWRPRDFVESLYPLSITYAALGHGVFRCPRRRRHPKCSAIYAITLTLSFYVIFGLSLRMAFNSTWFSSSSTRFYVICYVHLGTGAIAQSLSWYHRKRAAGFSKRVMKIDDTLRELGATFDYTASMKTAVMRLCLWILCCLVLNTIDIFWLLPYVPLGPLLLLISVFHYPIHVNSVVAVNFSIVVSHVGMRFRKANELLEKITKPVRKPVIIQPWRYVRTKISPTSSTISTGHIFHDATYKKHFIQIIRQVHLELKIVARDVNRVFGVQVILEMSGYFVLVIGLLYDIFSVATDPDIPKRFLRCAAQVIWCTTFLVKLTVMNVTCENVVAEARRTGDVLHFIEKAFSDPELNDEIQQFTFQLQQNPLFFSPLGLITLGWKFVQGFLATVTTYLIIIIQNDH